MLFYPAISGVSQRKELYVYANRTYSIFSTTQAVP